jgi:hypothetical protein
MKIKYKTRSVFAFDSIYQIKYKYKIYITINVKSKSNAKTQLATLPANEN